jgi:hypothetical protein
MLINPSVAAPAVTARQLRKTDTLAFARPRTVLIRNVCISHVEIRQRLRQPQCVMTVVNAAHLNVVIHRNAVMRPEGL